MSNLSVHPMNTLSNYCLKKYIPWFLCVLALVEGSDLGSSITFRSLRGPLHEFSSKEATFESKRPLPGDDGYNDQLFGQYRPHCLPDSPWLCAPPPSQTPTVAPSARYRLLGTTYITLSSDDDDGVSPTSPPSSAPPFTLVSDCFSSLRHESTHDPHIF
jgi:hypothetical protein